MTGTASSRARLARRIIGFSAALLFSAASMGIYAQESSKPAPKLKNELPEEVISALRSAGKATLYSLEPWEKAAAHDRTLHRYKILGQAELDQGRMRSVIAEFEAVVSGWDGLIAMCFDPRHAIRVTSGGATYDLLLCYECHQLYIYKDDRLVAKLGASGSPKKLNAMFLALNVPLSRSGERLAAEQRKAQTSYEKWTAAMPSSVKPLWDGVLRSGFFPKIDPLRPALAGEFPDRRQRILALYGWFGSGAGPWTGFPSYELVVEELLLDFSTEDLIDAASNGQLNPSQLEGAARLFAGGRIATDRPEDRDSVPPALRKRLLDHVLQSVDADKRARATKVFAATHSTPPVSRAAMDLIRASKSGDLPAVKNLLAQGAPLDGRDAYGKTALFWAVTDGHREVVRALLEKGAQVKGDVDSLMEAALQGHAEIVRMLLDKGADPSAKGWRGMSPLEAATRQRHEKIREMLLAAGARS
jgi:hypothetical protein